MIPIIEVLRLVLGYASEKKGRVFLTVAGIIIGIFTFTFFIFLSQGLSNAIEEQFTSFGVNVLAISPAGSTQTGPPSGEGLTDTDVAKIKQVTRGYKYVAPAIFYQGKYEYGRDVSIITSLAYPGEYIDEVKNDLGLKVSEGRLIREGDKGSVIIGSNVASDGFEDKEVSVGSSLNIEDRDLRVIGIIEEQGDLFVDNSLIMPMEDMKEISGQDTYSVIRASYFSSVDLEEARENIKSRLNPNQEDKRVEISSPEQEIEQLNNIIGVLSMIIGFVSSIALLVGGVNVMNTMHASVLERSKEISVMKALGATNGDIRKIFFIESGLFGFVGSMLGFFLSFLLAKSISYFIITYLGYNVPVYFESVFFILVITVTTVFTIIFGLYPAMQAAKVKPADNLKEE